ncbi:MAG: TRAP transporter permease [Deferrisomatales bacterium]
MKDRPLTALLSTGEYRAPEGWVRPTFTGLAVLIVVFAYWSNLFSGLDPYIKSALFLTSMLAVAFLLYTPTRLSRATRPNWADCLFALLSLATGAYIYLVRTRLLERWATVDPLTPLDWFFGVFVILASVEISRRILGPGITSITLLFVLYSLYGHLMPGQFYHRPVGLSYYVDSVVFTVNGLMGSTTLVAATYVFMFVAFGVFLDKANGGEFFAKVSNAVAGHRVGGPAKIAIVSSALYGTISGSPTSDVMTTGSFSIPLMKRAGLKATFAGAVEAVASTGGSILPPIMGSAAFLMVELTGTPYRQLAIAAFVPALLYYVGVYAQVHFHCARLGIAGVPRDQLPSFATVMRESGEFILPFVVIVGLLLSGYTPGFTAVAGTGSILALSWLRPQNRLTLPKLVKAIEVLVERLAPLTAACAAAGLVIAGITITGFGGRMLTIINSLSGDSLFIALLIAAAVTIVLGMGMPVPAVYILVAVLIAPALTDKGVSVLSAHLFLIYFCAMSAITPPIAVAAFAASTIAQADPMKIGWIAVRLGLAAFLVPFFFVYDNALLLQGPALWVLWSTVMAAVGLVGLSAGIEGYGRWSLGPGERVLAVAGSLAMIAPGLVTDVVGIGAVALVFLRRSRLRAAAAARQEA